MKFPNKIRIGGREYKIVLHDNLVTERDELGYIHLHNLKIHLQRPNDMVGESVVLETLAHEFAHGYYNQHHPEMDSEKNCNMFADMLVSFAKEMKWV